MTKVARRRDDDSKIHAPVRETERAILTIEDVLLAPTVDQTTMDGSNFCGGVKGSVVQLSVLAHMSAADAPSNVIQPPVLHLVTCHQGDACRVSL
jgi:hypothetical protein